MSENKENIKIKLTLDKLFPDKKNITKTPVPGTEAIHAAEEEVKLKIKLPQSAADSTKESSPEKEIPKPFEQRKESNSDNWNISPANKNGLDTIIPQAKTSTESSSAFEDSSISDKTPAGIKTGKSKFKYLELTIALIILIVLVYFMISTIKTLMSF